MPDMDVVRALEIALDVLDAYDQALNGEGVPYQAIPECGHTETERLEARNVLQAMFGRERKFKAAVIATTVSG